MGLMSFMEAMGTSNTAIVAAFFIGLMTAISPCPLVSNLTAIAYTSRRIQHSKHTLLVGLLYTLGRMFTYVILAALIVWLGISTQGISMFLQRYGERILGPVLVFAGLVMLGVFSPVFQGSTRLNGIKEKLADRGFLGSFMLGALLALAFCPFSAVLFFAMLIPLAIKAGDGILIPSVFALATGLPVIIFSFILAKSMARLGMILNCIQKVELWVRRSAGIIFIGAGIYYIAVIWL